MAKQIIEDGAVFKVYTEEERERENQKFKRDYNKVKDSVVEVVEARIVKESYGYVAYDKSDCIYPIDRVISKPKARQKYKLYLNSYQRVVKAERVV